VSASSKPDSYSWFSGDTGRYLFQSSIDIFRNNFSGLLFIKPLEASHRILFITEMGIKIFDMEIFRNGNPKVHYCLEAVNRKSVTKTLGKDLSLMIFSVAENDKVKMMQERSTAKKVIRSKDCNGTRFCSISEKTGKVEELISTGALTKKLNIKFYSESKAEPDSIILSHYNLKLNIHLVKLDEN
jgi:hypothetical protein